MGKQIRELFTSSLFSPLRHAHAQLCGAEKGLLATSSAHSIILNQSLSHSDKEQFPAEEDRREAEAWTEEVRARLHLHISSPFNLDRSAQGGPEGGGEQKRRVDGKKLFQ